MNLLSPNNIALSDFPYANLKICAAGFGSFSFMSLCVSCASVLTTGCPCSRRKIRVCQVLLKSIQDGQKEILKANRK